MVFNIFNGYNYFIYLIIIVIAFILVDAQDIIYNNFKNIPLAICMLIGLPMAFLGLINGVRPRRATSVYLAFLAYAAYGIYFNTVTDQPSGLNTQIFYTAMIGLIFPFISSRRLTIPIVRIFYAISLLMCILAIVYNGFLNFNYMTHERIFIASFVYSIPKFKKKKMLSYFGFLLFGAVILMDPRTTSLIAFAVTIVLTLLLERTASRRFVIFSSLASGIFVIFITYIVDWIKSINSNFKQATGGTDNNTFREGMISVGLQKYAESPIFGSFFKYGGAYEPPQIVYINSSTIGNILPLHNDYLEIMVSGGIIGLILFLICFFLPVANYLRNRDCISSENKITGDSLLISVIIGATTIAFNPVMNSSRSGFILAILSAILLYISGSSLRNDRFALSKP